MNFIKINYLHINDGEQERVQFGSMAWNPEPKDPDISSGRVREIFISPPLVIVGEEEQWRLISEFHGSKEDFYSSYLIYGYFWTVEQ